MTFHVGQKVVCVNARDFPTHGRMVYPREGAVYTVREIVFARDGETCIRLIEIVNPAGLNLEERVNCEPYFKAIRFRPVVERKTDISVFTALLNPQNHKPLITSDA